MFVRVLRRLVAQGTRAETSCSFMFVRVRDHLDKGNHQRSLFFPLTDVMVCSEMVLMDKECSSRVGGQRSVCRLLSPTSISFGPSGVTWRWYSLEGLSPSTLCLPVVLSGPWPFVMFRRVQSPRRNRFILNRSFLFLVCWR